MEELLQKSTVIIEEIENVVEVVPKKLARPCARKKAIAALE